MLDAVVANVAAKQRDLVWHPGARPVCADGILRVFGAYASGALAEEEGGMATFVPGMKCAISGRPITDIKEAVVFPAFVSNEGDPLYVFSDAIVHAAAFRTHPLAAAAQARYEEARRRSAPDKRHCLICSRLIVDPDDYLGLGHLVDDQNHALYRFNYAHFHRSCLAEWDRWRQLVSDLEALNQSGSWKGDALKRLISPFDLRHP